MSRIPVFNPQSLDNITEYLDRHFDHLAEIQKAIQDQESDERYLRIRGSGTADAAQLVNILLGTVPLGYDWIIERVIVAFGAGAAQNPSVLYTDDSSALNVVDLIMPTGQLGNVFGSGGVGGLYIGASAKNDTFIPTGRQLFFYTSTTASTGVVSVNLQVRQIKRKTHTHEPRNTDMGMA